MFPAVTLFLSQQGKMKFIRPLYQSVYLPAVVCSIVLVTVSLLYSDLHKCPGGRDLAVTTFTTNRSGYHPVATHTIAKDLGLQE